MSDKSDLPLFGIILLAAASGVFTGWTARGMFDGSTTTVSKSQDDSQEFVDSGVEAAAKVEESREEVQHAQGKVTVVIREVPVDADCPPGAGPVSSEWERQLRDLEKARSSPADGASRLPEEADK